MKASPGKLFSGTPQYHKLKTCPKFSSTATDDLSLYLAPVASGMSTDSYPIPDRLNTFLVAVVSVLAIGLLWLASHLQSWAAVFGIGVLFSYVMLTNYALLHDATHDTLRSSQRANDWCGFVTGIWFPVPFSMIHYTHRSHHRFQSHRYGDV